MRGYVCERCGAILDPGERCDCKCLRVVILHACGNVETRLTDGSLKALQDIVGGCIEHVRAFDDAGFLVNEEGEILGLGPNAFFPALLGNIIIIGEPADGGDEFRSLSEDEAEKIRGMFDKRRVRA